jgi:putative component of membrane protein insertase Oxa1/YidC/SpoIIIJ protein YidD
MFRDIRNVNHGVVCLQILQLTCSAFQHQLIHMISVTTAVVTAIRRQHSCGVQRTARNHIVNRFKVGHGSGQRWDL